MTDYIAVVADIALAAAAFVGTYYASVSGKLFKGDLVMEKVWRLATVAFVVVAFVSVLDLISMAGGSSLSQFHLVRIGAVVAVIIFVVAMIELVRWGKSTTEGGSQQSRQSPPR